MWTDMLHFAQIWISISVQKFWCDSEKLGKKKIDFLRNWLNHFNQKVPKSTSKTNLHHIHTLLDFFHVWLTISKILKK
jgi:hypothetical protein